MNLASATWWLAVCVLAWALLYLDFNGLWPRRRTVVCVLLLLVCCTAMALAAEIPVTDWCSQFDPWSFWWISYGCWGKL